MNLSLSHRWARKRSEPSNGSSGRWAAGELILDGRRYRLVPVEPTEAELAAEAADVAQLLTAREREVAKLVATGHVNKEIARILHISEWTVSSHLRRIFNKLGVETRAEMVYRWTRSHHAGDPTER
jgi:DNA-binding CsgD family transcriptional regulator